MNQYGDFAVAYYGGDRKTGALAVVECKGGDLQVHSVATAPASGAPPAERPLLLGVAEDFRAVLLDPKSKQITLAAAFPADAFPAHVYSDPHADLHWYMNDGDKETGNDTINCGDSGSSVTAIARTNSAEARYLGTVCVGRGHHQCHFSYPSEQAPEVPNNVWVSSLKDGIISVIGNDENDTSYLRVRATINLCEPDKEPDLRMDALPNNSFPHGLAYSPLTGKIYNLNNGYGTIAVIDPITYAIEHRIKYKGYSNLFAAPGGRFLVARGADRKSDPNHVVGKIAFLDATTLQTMAAIDLPDIYLSKYFFNAAGDQLYFTTGVSGSPEQQEHLKPDVLLVFDLKALPRLPAPRELKVGEVGTVDFVAREGDTPLVFASLSKTGALAIIDGARHQVLETVRVLGPGNHSRVWTLR